MPLALLLTSDAAAQLDKKLSHLSARVLSGRFARLLSGSRSPWRLKTGPGTRRRQILGRGRQVVDPEHWLWTRPRSPARALLTAENHL